jgi:hypothetical protein
MPQGKVFSDAELDQMLSNVGRAQPSDVERGFSDSFLPNITRIGLPLLALLGPGGWAGAGIAGGLGLLGEGAAQAMEGESFRPMAMATGGLLSAIPGGKLVAGQGAGRAMLMEALKGGGISSLAHTANVAVDEDRMPSMGEFAGSFGAGAAMGAGGRKLAQMLANRYKVSVSPDGGAGGPRMEPGGFPREIVGEASPEALAALGKGRPGMTGLPDTFYPGQVSGVLEDANTSAWAGMMDTPKGKPAAGIAPTPGPGHLAPEQMADVQAILAELQRVQGGDDALAVLQRAHGMDVPEAVPVSTSVKAPKPKKAPATREYSPEEWAKIEARRAKFAKVSPEEEANFEDILGQEPVTAFYDPEITPQPLTELIAPKPKIDTAADELAAMRSQAKSGIQVLRKNMDLKAQAEAAKADKLRLDKNQGANAKKPKKIQAIKPAAQKLPKFEISDVEKPETNLYTELSGKNLGVKQLVKASNGWFLTDGKKSFKLGFPENAPAEKVLKELGDAFPGTKIEFGTKPEALPAAPAGKTAKVPQGTKKPQSDPARSLIAEADALDEPTKKMLGKYFSLRDPATVKANYEKARKDLTRLNQRLSTAKHPEKISELKAERETLQKVVKLGQRFFEAIAPDQFHSQYKAMSKRATEEQRAYMKYRKD